MIPYRLEITNFLSYRETAELDFSGIQLACISGANGSGKSSILDAITWVLFGRSRTRSDDDLINRLAAIKDEAAEVRFTFILEGITYRIIRRKRLAKSAMLELQIESGEDSWKTLSERKLRETEAQIEYLLRMNYDTFTNASFLLQGKADQFTTRTANQRKEILAALLGVTEWERYREAAAEVRKIEEGKSAIFEARLAEIQLELAEQPQRELDLEQAKVAHAVTRERLNLQEELLKQMRQTAAAIEQQKKLVENLSANVERIKLNLASSQKTLQARQHDKHNNAQILAGEAKVMAEHATWQSAETEAESWQEKANGYNDLMRQKQPHEISVAQRQSRLEQEQQQLEANERQVQQAQNDLPALELAVEKETATLLEVENKLAELAGVQQSYHEAQAQLQQIEGQRKLDLQELDRLKTQEQLMRRMADEKASVLANQEKADALASTFEEQHLTLSGQQELYIKSKADLDSLRSQQNPRLEEMKKLKRRIDRLIAAEVDSECPTCGQPLSAGHRREVLAGLQGEGDEAGDIYRANKVQIEGLEQQVEELQGTFGQRERLERDQKTNQQRLANATARLAEIEQSEQEWHREAEKRLAALRSQLADDSAVKSQADLVITLQNRLQPRAALSSEQKRLQNKLSRDRAALAEMERQIHDWLTTGQQRLDLVNQKLTTEAFALEDREALADLQKEVDALAYDKTAHQRALARRDALADAPNRLQELRQAQAIVGPLENNITELEERTAEQEGEIVQQGQQLASAESQLQLLISDSGDLDSTEDAVFRLREDDIATARSVGAAQQRLDVLQDLQSQKASLEKDRTELSRRITRLKLLEKSCGRQGVQALLIEHALPEIEERANQLLDRLTGGDMNIYFDTQRKLKSRDAMAETLDIRIADKDGVRPYDNYSGGEQFRINFAIRLALSQLLARRAGARLQTLVIDEGFGSQDPQGRQRLVEAINAVRDEFACILVITHIAELRDAFSTRIEIEKTADGSTIQVV